MRAQRPQRLPQLLPVRQRPTQEALAAMAAKLHQLEQLEREVAQPNAICTAMAFGLLRQIFSSAAIGMSWRPILMTVTDFLEESIYPKNQCGANAASAAATISKMKVLASSPAPCSTNPPGNMPARATMVAQASEPSAADSLEVDSDEEQKIAVLKQGGALQCTPYFVVSQKQKDRLVLIRQDLKRMPFLQRRMKVVKPQLLSVLCNMAEVRKRPWQHLVIYSWKRALFFGRHVRDALEKVSCDLRPQLSQRFFAWLSVTKVERAQRAKAALQNSDMQVQQLRQELQSLRADMDDDALAHSQKEAAKAREMLNSLVEALRPGTLLPLAHSCLEDFFRRVAEIAMFWDLENLSSLETEDASVLIDQNLGPPVEGEEGMGPESAPDRIPLLPMLLRWVNFHVNSLRKITDLEDGDGEGAQPISNGARRGSLLGGKRTKPLRALDYASGNHSPKSPFSSPFKDQDIFRVDSPDPSERKASGPMGGVQSALVPKAPAALSAPLIKKTSELADGRALAGFLANLRLVVSGGDADFAAEALDCLDEPPGEKRIRRILIAARALLPPDAAKGLDLLHPQDLAAGDQRGMLLLLSSLFANAPALPPTEDRSPLVINMLERTRDLCGSSMIQQMQNPSKLLDTEESDELLKNMSAEEVLLRWANAQIFGTPKDENSRVQKLSDLCDTRTLAKLLRAAGGGLVSESSVLTKVANDVDEGQEVDDKWAAVRSSGHKLVGLKPSLKNSDANAVFLAVLFLRLPRLDVDQDSELGQDLQYLKELHDEWALEVRGLALQINSEAQRVSHFSEKRRRRISVEVAFAASTAEPTAKFASFYAKVQNNWRHIEKAATALENAQQQFMTLYERVSAWSVSEDLKRSKADDTDEEDDSEEDEDEDEKEEIDEAEDSVFPQSRVSSPSVDEEHDGGPHKLPFEPALRCAERFWKPDLKNFLEDEESATFLEGLEAHRKQVRSLFETYADENGRVDIWSMRRLYNDWGLAHGRTQRGARGSCLRLSTRRDSGSSQGGLSVRQLEAAFGYAHQAEVQCASLDELDADDEPASPSAIGIAPKTEGKRPSQAPVSLGIGGFAAALVALACIIYSKEAKSEPKKSKRASSVEDTAKEFKKSATVQNMSTTSTNLQTQSPSLAKGKPTERTDAKPKQEPPPTPSKWFESLMTRPFEQEAGEDRKTAEVVTAEDAMSTLLNNHGVIDLLRREACMLRFVFQIYADATPDDPTLVTAKQGEVSKALVHSDLLGKKDDARREMLIERVAVMRRGTEDQDRKERSSLDEGQENTFGFTFQDFCDCLVAVAVAADPDPFAPVCPKVEKILKQLCQGVFQHWQKQKEDAVDVTPAVDEFLAAFQGQSGTKPKTDKRKSVTFGKSEQKEYESAPKSRSTV